MLYYQLNNKVNIPQVGLGTWQVKDGDTAYNAVLNALRVGYRHIDTAQRYGNEISVGRAIKDFLKESGVKREELFITTKLANFARGYSVTQAAMRVSLKKLQLDYLDLFLIHWPNPIAFRNTWESSIQSSWKAMEEFYEKGKIRAIGVSNFLPHHINALRKTAKILPQVNQIKLCPSITQNEVVDFCKNENILLEAYSPMGTGSVLENSSLKMIAQKYNKTVAQICIRWSLEQSFLPLAKSVHKERMIENLDVFDFKLSKEDCTIISSLKDIGVTPPHNPDTINF